MWLNVIREITYLMSRYLTTLFQLPMSYGSASRTWVNYPKLGKSGFLWVTTHLGIHIKIYRKSVKEEGL